MLSEYNAGAGGDVFFRPLALQLAAATEQQWIIDNRAGAGGLVAVQAAMRSPADGYTLLIASQNVPVTRRYLSRAKPIEPSTDLTPISALWRTTLVIASHPSFQAKSLKELIAYARANPGKVSYATSGIGTQAHFAGANLAVLTGTTLHARPLLQQPPGHRRGGRRRADRDQHRLARPSPRAHREGCVRSP